MILQLKNLSNLIRYIGRKFVGGKFLQQKIFVGKKFRHFPKIANYRISFSFCQVLSHKIVRFSSSLFADEFSTDLLHFQNLITFLKKNMSSDINKRIILLLFSRYNFPLNKGLDRGLGQIKDLINLH